MSSVYYNNVEYATVKAFCKAMGLNYNTTRSYMSKGMSLEEIVEHMSKGKRQQNPKDSGDSVIYHDKEYASLSEAAYDLQLNIYSLNRIKREKNCTDAEAIDHLLKKRGNRRQGRQPRGKYEEIFFRGVTYASQQELLDRYRLSRTTVASRMKRKGESFLEAVEYYLSQNDGYQQSTPFFKDVEDELDLEKLCKTEPIYLNVGQNGNIFMENGMKTDGLFKNQQEEEIFRRIYKNSTAYGCCYAGCFNRDEPYIIKNQYGKTVIVFHPILWYKNTLENNVQGSTEYYGENMTVMLLLNGKQRELHGFFRPARGRKIESMDLDLINQYQHDHIGSAVFCAEAKDKEGGIFFISKRFPCATNDVATDFLWDEILRFVNFSKDFKYEYRRAHHELGHEREYTSGPAIFCHPRKP